MPERHRRAPDWPMRAAIAVMAAAVLAFAFIAIRSLH